MVLLAVEEDTGTKRNLENSLGPPGKDHLNVELQSCQNQNRQTSNKQMEEWKTLKL